MPLLGLLVLNVLFLVAGSGVLWAVRGWADWREWLGLAGVAYLVGLGSCGVLMTLDLVYGGRVAVADGIVTCLALTVAGFAAGLLRGRPLPRLGDFRLPRTSGSLAAAGLGLGTALLLVAFYRQARVDPLTSWDAWAFWIPKAKTIYFFGGIGSHLFTSFAGPSYPLFIPALDVMDFRFMGSPDTTLLAVQYWLLLVGFLLAMAGLLRSLAPAWLVWLFGAATVILPGLDSNLLRRVGDWPLDIFFVVAALAIARWVLTNERWTLVVFGVLLSAAMATKREGQLLAAVLIVAAAVAPGVRRLRSWPIPVVVAALAYAPNVPWRLWWESRHLTPDAPPDVVGATLHLSRAPESVWLVLRLTFSFGLWSLAVPIALVAALVLLTRRDRRVAVLFLVAIGLGVLGWAWVNWSDPTLVLTTQDRLNPTDRAVGSLALLSLGFAPLLLGALLAPEGVPVRLRRVTPESAPALR